MSPDKVLPTSAGKRGRRIARSVLAGVWLLAAGTLAQADPQVTLSPARTAAEADLVDIRALVPDIAEDIRYAGSDNFVGAPVDGYLAPKCLLKRPVAQALARVEHELRAQHRRLKLWDCYRPVRAVANFVRWGHDLSDQRTKAAHYPNLDKRVLLGDYIAPVSGHSRGGTADLTMEQCDTRGNHCKELDMGTPFDFFDVRAHTDSPDVTPAQHANRLALRAAMDREGFKNYTLEWWHYTWAKEPTPNTIYDVPVK
ncbi:MAG: M15 family metallopeptidase [Frateuria sp.]|nr:M15 family metallopeptidase [Frateuria sp.]